MTYFSDTAQKLGDELSDFEKRIAEQALVDGAPVDVAVGRIRTHRRVELFKLNIKDIADDLDLTDIAAAQARVESGASADDVASELQTKVKGSQSALDALSGSNPGTATGAAPPQIKSF